jgi:hypothetical protein
MDYKTPPLTPAQQQALKPLTLVVGEADGLVYVGRQSEFTAAFSNLTGSSQYILLPAGNTWKSKKPEDLFPTGHNIWDRYINVDGKPVLQVYKLLTDLVTAEAPGAFQRIQEEMKPMQPDLEFTQELASLRVEYHDVLSQFGIPEIGDGVFKQKADEIVDAEGDELRQRFLDLNQEYLDALKRLQARHDATARVDEVFRNYANFFLFRQFVKDHEEYVLTPTEHRTEMTRKKLDLDGYIAKADALYSAYRSDLPLKLQKALEDLRSELGIKEPLNLIRAQKELAVPDITPERAKILADYMAKADAAEEEFKKVFKDPDYDRELAALEAEFGKILAGLGVTNIADYKPKLDEYNGIKKPTQEQSKIRSALARLHQKYAKTMKDHRVRFDSSRDSLLNSLPRPEGIDDYGAALRESKADRSPERRAKLQAFIDRYAQVESAVREQAARELEEALAKLDVPNGVATIDSAKAAKLEQDTFFNFTYAPAGDSELTALASEIADLGNQREELAKQIEASEKDVKEGANRRSALLRTWEGLWKKGILSSDRLREAGEAVQHKLDLYTKMYFDYEHRKGLWMRGLKATGQLTEENILRATPELISLREQVLGLKQQYEDSRSNIEDIRRSEALAGRLTGPAGAVNEAQKSATELWSGGSAGPGLIQKMRQSEDGLEALRRRDSEAEQKLARAQMDYGHLMLERGHKLPFTITRVSLREALDLPYNDLIARLKEDPVLSEAFRAGMERWSAYLSLLRVESQSKDTGNY